MDSRQVYRGMDVGTGKVTPEERAEIPHHGLDLVNPDERYSAGQFARDARGWIDGIRLRGRLPLLVGGTGFFLRALAHPVFREPALEPERRQRLRRWLRGLDRQEMARWAGVLDPERARLARAGGRQRLSRTIEVSLLTGRPLTWWHRWAPLEGDAIEIGVILLTLPREELRRRIDGRVVRMFQGGLLDETRGLLEAGFTVDAPGVTATGYREAARSIAGEIDLREAVRLAQGATRRYARRQLTWFRNQPPRPDVTIDSTAPLADQIDQIVDWWEGIGAGGRSVRITPRAERRPAGDPTP